jgi:glycosyltransferase involved in cell wall biosynthesis/2-polyprenyl-3-methyl-5-hydroxy-6-metoxy-1,4-benzoquinol methylase
MNIAPISVCIIAKNERNNLEKCLKSLRPYVNEIVVVDTGSTDETPEIARKYADKFEIYTECNDSEGRIESFSKARNRSFELASNEWCMWVDADDEVVGADKLNDLVELYSKKYSSGSCFIMFPYEYSHDEHGNVTCLHYRERLFHNFKDNFNWVNPVHEVIIPKPSAQNINSETNDSVKVVHHRDGSGKVVENGRNLRILKKHLEVHGEGDARHLYYIGLEYGNHNDLDNGIKYLIKYLEISGWDDEKYMAALRLADYYLVRNQIENAIDISLRATTYRENWGEAYFYLARLFYYKANADNNVRNWERCAHFAKLGLSCPETKTVLFVNPKDRNIEVHRYLNMALNKLGDVIGALESVNSALNFAPDDEQLMNNKKAYESFILKDGIIKQLNELNDKKYIDNDIRNKISSLISESADINKIENRSIIYNENLSVKGDSIMWKPYHRPEGYPNNVKEEDFPVAEKTPHAQAWGIPEEFVYDDLPIHLTDKQLQAVVGLIYKEYMFHDELMSAFSFLEKAPYRVRHSDFINELVRKTKKTLSWMEDDKNAQKINAPQYTNGEVLQTEMFPLPCALTGAVVMRYHWIVDRMPNKSGKLLDFGCVDGEMTNRWGMEGYRVTGLDLCKTSVDIANDAARRFNTGAVHINTYFKDAVKHVPEKSFDYITCADTYEHIPDRINDLLIPARKFVKDDGKMLMVTPHGAWFRGEFVSYAHPWLYGPKGESWLDEKNPRAHIIAPTVWESAEEFRKAGWYVKNAVVVEQWIKDVPSQGNVCVEAFPNPPSNYPGLDIVFYSADAPENWTPHTADLKGIGGSETAVIQMAKNLAEKGNKVRVYNNCGRDGEGIYDGVEYYSYEKMHHINCDVLISSRLADGLAVERNINAKSRILWVHDVCAKGLTPELALRADKIFALSEWHKQNILNCYNYLNPDQIVITSNGIDLERFNKDIARNPHKAIISSSPDRYLLSLLQMWPRIRQQVPDAELHIFYGFYNWETCAKMCNDQGQLKLISDLRAGIESLKNQGVVFRDRTNQYYLATEFLSSGVWPFSTCFSETSCISAMEAQAAGLKMITSPIAALNETASNATFIQGDWLSSEYQAKFIEATVDAMLNSSQDERNNIMQGAQKFSWTKVADQWQELFDKLVKDMDVAIVPNYR